MVCTPIPPHIYVIYSSILRWRYKQPGYEQPGVESKPNKWIKTFFCFYPQSRLYCTLSDYENIQLIVTFQLIVYWIDSSVESMEIVQ